MTKVFVHGNPETSAIWGPLVRELSARGIDDVVLLSPPGFGATVPDGWGATQDEYRAWLLEQLHVIGGPVDLVGHDWGAGHVYGVLAAEPGLVRTWAADCAGLLHPDYVWHDAAQAWQTPGVGEAAAEGLVSMPEDVFASVFGPLGMGEQVSRQVSAGLDADTARCIVSLYRSAAQPAMSRLGAAFRAAAPSRGMVVVAELDNFAGTDAMHAEVAGWVGAGMTRLAGVGHWWMVENPSAAADALARHWAG
ncbi:MAG: alpha/beta fold hydrolase [Ilumatobacteraceae bacterium]